MDSIKEKAIKLIEKYLRVEDNTMFYWNCYDDKKMSDNEALLHAKKCALIVVEEIIESIEFSLLHHLGSQYLIEKLNFWDSVRQELMNYE